MVNEFLEYGQKWAVKNGKSSWGFPILKLLVGSTQFRVIDKVPTGRVIHFRSVGKKPVVCPEEGCIFCSRGDEKSTRHFLNVVDRRDNKVKVLVYSPAVQEAIDVLILGISTHSENPAKNHPKNYDIRIIREGTTRKDTRYTAVQVNDVGFDENSYKPYDLEKTLVPMSPEEMLKKQGESVGPTTKGERVRVFDGEPAVQASIPKVETVIHDDDKERI